MGLICGGQLPFYLEHRKLIQSSVRKVTILVYTNIILQYNVTVTL